MKTHGDCETVRADVALIGAGLTGLWTAWHLRQLGVERVVVLERDYAGCELYGRFSAGVRRADRAGRISGR